MRIFLKGFKQGFTNFTHLITNTVNCVLLTLVYFTALAATSLLAKVFKKEFLNLKRKDKKTYWEDLNLEKENVEDYLKQF